MKVFLSFDGLVKKSHVLVQRDVVQHFEIIQRTISMPYDYSALVGQVLNLKSLRNRINRTFKNSLVLMAL